MLVAATSLIVGAMLFVSVASAQPSTSSLQLVVLGGVAAPTGTTASTQAHYGSQVTFNVQTNASQPWVGVNCYQNGEPVFAQYWGFWAGYTPSTITTTMAVGGVFTLGPNEWWSSGSADCVASLFTFSKNGRQSTLSTLPFSVSA